MKNIFGTLFRRKDPKPSTGSSPIGSDDSTANADPAAKANPAANANPVENVPTANANPAANTDPDDNVPAASASLTANADPAPNASSTANADPAPNANTAANDTAGFTCFLSELEQARQRVQEANEVKAISEDYLLTYHFFDELSLVQERADENPFLAKQLHILEARAIAEVEALPSHRSFVDLVTKRPLTKAQLAALPMSNKEELIELCASSVIIDHDLQAGPTMAFTFSADRLFFDAGTLIYLFNFLEKMDGALNLEGLTWRLDLCAPAGTRSGLIRYLSLIHQLYPWVTGGSEHS